MKIITAEIPAVLLVGGLGKRLWSVLPATPKPLAPIGDTPFLRLLLLQLRSQGIRRFVMCTGHLADQIKQEFCDGKGLDAVVDYSQELSPLGTGGAIKNAESLLPDVSEFLVMNGDSFLEFDLREFISFHRQHGGLVSMAVRAVPDAARYGTVHMDESNRVVGFSEKTGDHTPGVINGGVYVFNRDILRHIQVGPASLERDVFPIVLGQGIYGLEQHGMFIDIGTPEDYSRAQELCSKLLHAAAGESTSTPVSGASSAH